MAFIPCQGKHACRESEEKCLTCGRTLEEINWLRQSLDELASLAITHEYDNVGEFSDYIAKKLPKMVSHRIARADEIARTTREAVRAD